VYKDIIAGVHIVRYQVAARVGKCNEAAVFADEAQGTGIADEFADATRNGVDHILKAETDLRQIA